MVTNRWTTMFALAALAGTVAPVVAAEASANGPAGVTNEAVVAASANTTAASREVSGDTHWSSASVASAGNYRWTMSRGVLDLGVRFDAMAPTGRIAETPINNAGPMVASLPALSLGLRSWSVGPSAQASTLLERAQASAASEPAGSYVSKVGIEWKPAQPQVAFMRGGLGIHLDGDDRWTMRLRKGVLGIYLKQDF